MPYGSVIAIKVSSFPPIPHFHPLSKSLLLSLCVIIAARRSLLIPQVLDNTGTGTTSNLLAGIQRAHDHYFYGTNNPAGRTYSNGFSAVINFSIGYSTREPLVENALQAVFPHAYRLSSQPSPTALGCSIVALLLPIF